MCHRYRLNQVSLIWFTDKKRIPTIIVAIFIEIILVFHLFRLGISDDEWGTRVLPRVCDRPWIKTNKPNRKKIIKIIPCIIQLNNNYAVCGIIILFRCIHRKATRTCWMKIGRQYERFFFKYINFFIFDRVSLAVTIRMKIYLNNFLSLSFTLIPYLLKYSWKVYLRVGIIWR